MNNTKRVVPGSLHLAFAALLSLVVAPAVSVAANAPAIPVDPAAASQVPVEQLDELEQVWVRGKHLSEAIEDSEDDFFKLYNKLNTDSDYDVFCGRMSLNSGSMLMVRKCTPGFVVYSAYDAMTNTVRIGTQCGNVTGYSDSTGQSYFMSSCATTSTGSGYSGSYYSPGAPPSGLQIMDRGPAYLKNVLQVVTSDPRLLEKVKYLATLYNEMDAAQQRYVKLKDVSKADSSGWRTPKPNRGPRAL